MLDTLLDLLAAYGYPIVFFAAMLENVFLVGMFVPGQVVVLTAGLASGFARLDPVTVALLAAIGETVGNVVSLLLGKYLGQSLFERRSELLERRGVDLDEAKGFVEKHGAAALLLGRPAWGLKNVLPAMAGAAGMSLWKATFYVMLSSLLYYPLLVGVAYAVGLGVEEAASFATWLGVAVAVLIASVVTAIYIRRRRRRFSRSR